MEVILPGGLANSGSIERQARFRPLTGRIEQALIESEMTLDRAGYVTAVLGTALESIGKQAVDDVQVADLCVADRQYLMLRLGAMLHGEQMWLKVDCGHCKAPFDVDIRRCDLPVKEAGHGFPQVTVRVNDSVICARVPTGVDQDRIGELSEEDAMRQLLQNCIHSINGSTPDREFIDELSGPDVEVIDEAFDEVSPAVCNRLLVACPECGREQHAELDHYLLADIHEHSFYDEVHTLASHYHWSEAEILDLPQARRRLYLDMITRTAGAAEHGRLA
jgi:hypothetical protein